MRNHQGFNKELSFYIKVYLGFHWYSRESLFTSIILSIFYIDIWQKHPSIKNNNTYNMCFCTNKISSPIPCGHCSLVEIELSKMYQLCFAVSNYIKIPKLNLKFPLKWISNSAWSLVKKTRIQAGKTREGERDLRVSVWTKVWFST